MLKFSIFARNKVNAQDFPNFARRIEDLRDYVDERKGRGFWHSVHKNSGQEVYWFMVFGTAFAVIGLLFAVLILAAEIVQAWASVTTMHALKLST